MPPKPWSSSTHATPSSSTAKPEHTPAPAQRAWTSSPSPVPTHFAEVHNGVITLGTITPEDVGLTRAPIDALQGGDACTNARILTAIFSGERSPRRDIVLLNAAAVLVTADLAPDLPTGVALAAKAIDSGAVTKLVNLSPPQKNALSFSVPPSGAH